MQLRESVKQFQQRTRQRMADYNGANVSSSASSGRVPLQASSPASAAAANEGAANPGNDSGSNASANPGMRYSAPPPTNPTNAAPGARARGAGTNANAGGKFGAVFSNIAGAVFGSK